MIKIIGAIKFDDEYVIYNEKGGLSPNKKPYYCDEHRLLQVSMFYVYDVEANYSSDNENTVYTRLYNVIAFI